MHEARHPGAVGGVLVILQSLHEGASAVTHPHNGDAHLTHQDDSFSEMLSAPPPCRSDAINSFSHRTSPSTDSRPSRCNSSSYLSPRSLVPASAPPMPSTPPSTRPPLPPR